MDKEHFIGIGGRREMNKKALELKIKGIKCDNCDYKNENAKFEEYEEWLNRPCPKCGANLLTQEDLDTVKTLISLTNIFNEILPEPKGDEKKVAYNVAMNGTGEVNFKLNESEVD